VAANSGAWKCVIASRFSPHRDANVLQPSPRHRDLDRLSRVGQAAARFPSIGMNMFGLARLALLSSLSIFSISAAAQVVDETKPYDVSPYWLKAAAPDASPLVRVVLGQALQLQTTTGMPVFSVPAATGRAIREAATHDAATDPMVQALDLTAMSREEASGQRVAAIDLLVKSIADNAYFGLALLGQPEIQGDAALEQKILAQAANATRYRSSYELVQKALYQRFLALHWAQTLPPGDRGNLDDQEAAVISASGFAAAFAIPGNGAVLKLCKSADQARRVDCLRLGQHLFAGSDNVADAIIALRLIELGAATDADKEQAVRERRRIEWQQSQMAKLWQDGARDATQISASLRRHLLLTTQETELVALRHTLEIENLPLDPPTGWRSRAEEIRALQAALDTARESAKDAAKKTD